MLEKCMLENVWGESVISVCIIRGSWGRGLVLLYLF